MDEDIPDQQVNIQITNSCGLSLFQNDQAENLANKICGYFNLSDTNISIALVNNSQIRELNRQFLKSDNVTDVLSFDLSDDKEKSKCYEIIVNAELAEQQAQKRKHTAQTELALYITHGLLHQLGFDDRNKQSAQKMHKKEEEILNQLGFDFVYND